MFKVVWEKNKTDFELVKDVAASFMEYARKNLDAKQISSKIKKNRKFGNNDYVININILDYMGNKDAIKEKIFTEFFDDFIYTPSFTDCYNVFYVQVNF